MLKSLTESNRHIRSSKQLNDADFQSLLMRSSVRIRTESVIRSVHAFGLEPQPWIEGENSRYLGARGEGGENEDKTAAAA